MQIQNGGKMREDNDNKQNVRTKILELVQKEYPETPEENMKKIKEYLFRATIDDCERILNAFLRFGVKEIFEAVG